MGNLLALARGRLRALAQSLEDGGRIEEESASADANAGNTLALRFNSQLPRVDTQAEGHGAQREELRFLGFMVHARSVEAATSEVRVLDV